MKVQGSNPVFRRGSRLAGRLVALIYGRVPNC
jgi:hypothetical protein